MAADAVAGDTWATISRATSTPVHLLQQVCGVSARQRHVAHHATRCLSAATSRRASCYTLSLPHARFSVQSRSLASKREPHASARGRLYLRRLNLLKCEAHRHAAAPHVPPVKYHRFSVLEAHQIQSETLYRKITRAMIKVQQHQSRR